MGALTLIAFCALSFVFGYFLGKTRSRDRLPREIYDAQGRRIL